MEFEKAKEDFLKANKIEPSNKQILEGIKIYKEKKHEYKNNSQKFSQKIFEEKTSLYEEQVKETHNVVEEAKQPVARRSIPLLFWKITESILNIASPLINIPDKLPCVGGVCKRTKSGAARIVRDKYFKVFSITEEETKQNYEEEKEHLKKD